jgi:predicted DNA-binding protein YlxM (UPF0122 family)
MAEGRAAPEEHVRSRERVAALADRYGALLSERQRAAVALYYGEDLTLAEVAARSGTSRQAVHDALRRAASALEALEARLGLLAADAARERDVCGLLAAVAALRAGRGSLDEVESRARALV